MLKQMHRFWPPTVATISVVDLMPSLLFHSLPSDVARSALGGLSQSEYNKLKKDIPDNQIYSVNKVCLKQNN